MKSKASAQVLDTMAHDPTATRSIAQGDNEAASTGPDHEAAQDHESPLDWGKDFDFTAYDLKAHTLLCAELLNGEGIDRLPDESDSELAARLWADWTECKFFALQKLILRVQSKIVQSFPLIHSVSSCPK
jgi:hypothetical protein